MLQGQRRVRFSGLHLGVVCVTRCGADGPSTRGGAAGVSLSAVQADGAAQSVVERPHGDGAGAGQGGRGRALQDQRRVRLLEASSQCRFSRLVCHVLGGRSVHSARCCTIPGVRFRWTALHRASWNGHTETAMALVKAGADVNCKDNVGCGSRAASLCRWFATGLGGVLVWLRRLTALHLALLNGHTKTAIALVKAGADVHCKATDGCGSRVASRRLALCATGK